MGWKKSRRRPTTAISLTCSCGVRTMSRCVPLLPFSLPCFFVAVGGHAHAVAPALMWWLGLQIEMYKKFGYSVYRQVIGYYSGHSPEDAYGTAPPAHTACEPLHRPM
jgi:hypothetical protein